MKKFFLTFLLFSIARTTYGLAEPKLNDPEYLKFILGAHRTGEIESWIHYNLHGAMTGNYAYVGARRIK